MPGMVTVMVSRRRWLLVGVVFFSACLWSSYEKILRIHVEVLSSMVEKAADSAAAGRRPTPNDITELLYPLSRARQFLRQYEKQAGRDSYRSFESLLDRYERLAREIDVARVSDDGWQRLRPRLAAEGASWREAAATVVGQAEREAHAGA